MELSEWLRTVTPRINEGTGNWEVFDMSTCEWIDTKINAKGTGMYVTEIADESGWMLHINAKNEETGAFEMKEIFLPAMPAYGMSLVYRSMSKDNQPETIYSLYDKDGKEMLLTADAVINFKLYGNNIEAYTNEENRDKWSFFYDVYQTTKAAASVNVASWEIEAQGNNIFNLAVATNVSAFANGANYKASLNVAFDNGNNTNSAASDYFNMQTVAITTEDVHAIIANEDKNTVKEQPYVALNKKQFSFVYNEELKLAEKIFAGYSIDAPKEENQLLPFEEVTLKFATKDANEKLFLVDANGTVSVNPIYDASVAIDYVCTMTVSFYLDGEKIRDDEEFTVKAERDEPLPVEEGVMYNADGNATFQLQWSNTEASSMPVELHKGTTSLYSQFNGRDAFIASIEAANLQTKNFSLYSFDKETNMYTILPGVTLTWTKGATPAEDKLIVNAVANAYAAEDTYYVSDATDETLAEKPAIHTNSIPVKITLGVDLYKGTVTPNPLFIVNKLARVNGIANNGTHSMKADLASRFTIDEELEVEFRFVMFDDPTDPDDLTYVDVDQLTYDGITIDLTSEGEISIANPQRGVELNDLRDIDVVIVPVGYPEKGEKALINGDFKVRFENPVDANSIKVKTVASQSGKSGYASFDLANIIQEMKDVFGNNIILKGEIVDENATVTEAKGTNWANTYGIIAKPSISLADVKFSAEGTTDKALREYFRIQGNNLIFESGIIPERPITITVTPVVETYWGTIKVAPISFQLSVN